MTSTRETPTRWLDAAPLWIKNLGLQDADEPAALQPAVGRPGHYDAHLTYYLGRDRDHDHTALEVRISRPQHPDSTRTTTHEPVDPAAPCLTFTGTSWHGSDAAHAGAWAGEAVRTTRSIDPGRFGRYVERLRVPRFEHSRDRHELADLADRWHLHDLRAGCAHMPNVAALPDLVPALVADKPYDTLPDWLDPYTGTHWTRPPAEKYGRPDWQGWALDHLACPHTAYRYGRAWLHEPIPPATWGRLCELLPGLAEANDAVAAS